MDASLEMAAKMPLKVTLYMNIYPVGISPILNTSLRVPDPSRFWSSQSSIDQCFVHLVTTLTELSIVTIGGGLMQLASIGLSFLHNLTLFIQPEKRGFQGEHSCVHHCVKDGQETVFER